LSKTNIHATCISYRDNGILLIGPSGSGKSDLALRMMMNKGAQLVADDRTDVEEKFGRLRATCPENIRGMMEVRGIGLCRFEPCPSVFVELAVELVPAGEKIERLPEAETAEFCGVKIPKIRLHGFEISAIDKIILACYQNK
jgi:HPr kinase/phosphorylase